MIIGRRVVSDIFIAGTDLRSRACSAVPLLT